MRQLESHHRHCREEYAKTRYDKHPPVWHLTPLGPIPTRTLAPRPANIHAGATVLGPTAASDLTVADSGPPLPRELAALPAACRGPELRDRRDGAMVRLMVETGLRAGEVIAMTVPDVDLARGSAVIHRGKVARVASSRTPPSRPAPPRRVSPAFPHLLRHTAAHRWLAASGSEGGLLVQVPMDGPIRMVAPVIGGPTAGTPCQDPNAD